MAKLWQQLLENGSFVLVCVLIVAVLAVLARLVERHLPQKRKVTPARRICIIAICSAIAVVLHVLDFPLVFLAPEFYKLDFSELPVLLCGFYPADLKGAGHGEVLLHAGGSFGDIVCGNAA